MRERAILEALVMCEASQNFQEEVRIWKKDLANPIQNITRQRLDKIREHPAKNLSRW